MYIIGRTGVFTIAQGESIGTFYQWELVRFSDLGAELMTEQQFMERESSR